MGTVLHLLWCERVRVDRCCRLLQDARVSLVQHVIALVAELVLTSARRHRNTQELRAHHPAAKQSLQATSDSAGQQEHRDLRRLPTSPEAPHWKTSYVHLTLPGPGVAVWATTGKSCPPTRGNRLSCGNGLDSTMTAGQLPPFEASADHYPEPTSHCLGPAICCTSNHGLPNHLILASSASVLLHQVPGFDLYRPCLCELLEGQLQRRRSMFSCGVSQHSGLRSKPSDVESFAEARAGVVPRRISQTLLNVSRVLANPTAPQFFD